MKLTKTFSQQHATVAIVATVAVILVGVRPQWAAIDAAGERQRPTLKQLERLFDAATREAPPRFKLRVFSRFRSSKKSDEEIRKLAEDEAKAFRNETGEMKTDAEMKEEIARIIEEVKARNGEPRYYYEEEFKAPKAYRCDQRVMLSLTNFPSLDLENPCPTITKTNFATTYVNDFNKGSHYHFQINWELHSSKYDYSKSAYAERAHWEAMEMDKPLRLLLRPFMANRKWGILGDWRFSENKARRLINGSFPHYQLFVTPGTYEGKSVDELEVIKPETDELVARFVCQRDNYNRIYLTKIFNVDRGELYYTAKRAEFDENDWPWYWFSGEEDLTGRWIAQTRWFCAVDLNPTFDDETFAFNPPDEFGISNMSSGNTVIERYPKVAGKRLGPEDVVWDDGVDHSGGGSWIRMEHVAQGGFLLLLMTILPLLLWARNRQDPGKS